TSGQNRRFHRSGCHSPPCRRSPLIRRPVVPLIAVGRQPPDPVAVAGRLSTLVGPVVAHSVRRRLYRLITVFYTAWQRKPMNIPIRRYPQWRYGGRGGFRASSVNGVGRLGPQPRRTASTVRRAVIHRLSANSAAIDSSV